MSLEAVEEVEAGGVWEQMIRVAHDRLAEAIADAEARRRAGLFNLEDVSGWSVHAMANGTVYVQHECGEQYAPPARDAADALANIVTAASGHTCPS